jgi:sulfate adenylyltransferase subunit 1 (EFTu-like GTPase family)
MNMSAFRFLVSRIDRLASDMIYVAGHLETGVIQPECSAVVEGTGLRLQIKSVVLIHPVNAAAKEITLMVESLPANEKNLIGKYLVPTENSMA